jgi:hypothetical protein
MFGNQYGPEGTCKFNKEGDYEAKNVGLRLDRSLRLIKGFGDGKYFHLLDAYLRPEEQFLIARKKVYARLSFIHRRISFHVFVRIE